MQAFRFLRRDRSQPTSARAADDARVGLATFVSEHATSAKAKGPRSGGSLGSQVLAILVVLQAVPTLLWIGEHFQSLVTAESLPTAAAPPVIAQAPAIATAAPCQALPLADPGVMSDSAAARPPSPRTSAANLAAATPAMLAGHLAVDAPVDMRVYERGRLIATTEVDTVMLPAGPHDLEFVNDAVGYRVRRTVTVQPGQTVKLQLVPPRGTLHVNAVPWAEVWIDNERVGETPIGNLQTRIGTRQITFRHPDFGERRTTALVTLATPARVSMDMRTK